MSIKYPKLKNPVPSVLHEMIREKCEDYFSDLEDIAPEEDSIEEIEHIFEEDIAAIGKMVLTVHYQEDYARFVRELQEQAENDEEE